MMILWIILVVNLLCALLYAVVKIVRKENPWTAVLFLFLPVLGFIIYFLPRLFLRLLGHEQYDRDSFVRRFQIERMATHPNVAEELSVVPVEDAMAVSANADKRALLLNQLKKDTGSSYRVLLAAENDQDSESAHYVAAAKMEAGRLLQQRWTESSDAYISDPENQENYHEACTALREIIASGVLSPRETKLYQNKYCGLILEQQERDPDVIQQLEYESYLCYLVDLDEHEQAIRFWEEHLEQVKSEVAYMKMLELFYKISDHRRFLACLRQLQADRDVRLSTQGLERLRYWKARCEKDGIAQETCLVNSQ